MQKSSSKLNSKILQSTGKIADSALNHCINLNSKATQSATQHIPAIEHIQHLNFHMSFLDFSGRRLDRSLSNLERLMDGGKSQNLLSWLWYFCVDILLWIWDIVYGIFQPIIYFLWMTLLRAFLVVAFNFIFFGGIYYLIIY